MKRLMLFSLLSLGLVTPVAHVQANQEENPNRPVSSAVWHATFTGLGAMSLYLHNKSYVSLWDGSTYVSDAHLKNAAMIGLIAGAVSGVTVYAAKKRNMSTGIHSLIATLGAVVAGPLPSLANFVGLLIIDPLLP
jgi:hypothetical protein